MAGGDPEEFAEPHRQSVGLAAPVARAELIERHRPAIRAFAPQPQDADHLPLQRRQLVEPADRGGAGVGSGAHFVRMSLR